MEHFFKVSHIRTDGGSGDTTFIGYGAEGCALNYAKELESNKHMRYVSVVQRQGNRFGGDLSWDLIREYKFKEAPGE